MSIKPYLDSNGKIDDAFLQGGGGNQNLKQVLQSGNDAGSLSITNLSSLSVVQVNSTAPNVLTIGDISPNINIQSLGDINLDPVGSLSFGVSLQSNVAPTGANAVALPFPANFSGEYLVVKMSDGNTYKIALYLN